ncbi:hypothetical protein [Methylocella sp.]|uniref:hypothetical protein n=1 Tax=Methylocella sp. TaxID=1978226 RepID=UPI0035B0FE51
MRLRNLRRFGFALAGAALFAAAPVAAKSGKVAYAPGGGWTNLSQDPESGAGFYPLPGGAGTLQERSRRPVAYANERSAIGTAIQTEAIAHDYDEGYAFGNGDDVFDPDEGVGTPFFGGYYR